MDQHQADLKEVRPYGTPDVNGLIPQYNVWFVYLVFSEVQLYIQYR